MRTHYSRYEVKDRVIVDGHRDLVAIVTGVLIRETRVPTYEVSWINAGQGVTAWIEEYRLKEYKP